MPDDVQFQSVAAFRSLLVSMPGTSGEAADLARLRNSELTKPPGALGRLEELAIWYASWRGTAAPRIKDPQAIVFAANHGVTAQGVSAFPAEVTAQMVGNFRQGGAAINQMCRANGLRLSVLELDLARPVRDFTQTTAMDEAELCQALTVGWNAVDPVADLLVTGEMGIGNTTSAAAIATALFGGHAADWAGRGTGVDDAGMSRKISAIERGIACNIAALDDPLHVLAAFGGREIAAMAGAIARARTERIPVILDGFICGAAAAVLHEAHAGMLDHCVAGHVSAEGGHPALLERIGKKPILDLGMRLGEGSGAALAVAVLRAALECHTGMATFAEAAVSGRT